MNIHGDCLVEMAKMGPNSVDAIVTDPPYGLKFMGKVWDHGLPGMPFWIEALRVAKPGAFLLAFGGTRTFHRLTCAIEDAGWEIRDCLGWFYGSGFPKSHNVALDYEQRLCDYVDKKWVYKDDETPMRREAPFRSDLANEWAGFGTALKPAWEPIILARKPLDGTVAECVQKWGTGAVNVDGCRVGTDRNIERQFDKEPASGKKFGFNNHGEIKFSNGQIRSDGWLTKGRWPANLIHDGSDEVVAGFPNSTVTGNRTASSRLRANGNGNPFGGTNLKDSEYTDSGSAARFFYCAKASRAEREMGLEGMPNKSLSTMSGGEFKPDMSGQNHNAKGCPNNHTARNLHPTVKPLALMRYLCRLVTPPNGLILDPFMGSGTTGMACKAEGFRFIGIDNNAEYVEIAKKRINAVVYEPKLIPGVEATL